MNSRSNHPVLVSMTGLIGVLGVAWFCDGLLRSINNYVMQTFTPTYVILWLYALVALLLAGLWLLLAWSVLIRLPGNTWVFLVYLLFGLLIVIYPALIFTPALCCRLPYISVLQIAPTMYLYSSGGCLAIIGLAGLVMQGKRRKQD